MSRPCFALSVMLCCMAGPLLIIGKTHARDTVVSPGHDPGECIVCPLAHSPLGVCGGYSDYDYNQYWHDCPPPASSAASPQSDPELKVAQSLADDSAGEAWESGYEDYYADYVFGDDSTTTADEDLTNEDLTLEATVDAEAYEDEWFSYGSETTLETREINDSDISESTTAIESAEQLSTGYDAAYDTAMGTEVEAAEPVADSAPAVDAGESFSDAYDDLYDFETAAFGSANWEAGEIAAESVVAESNEQLVDSTPAWLADLVTQMLVPVRTATEDIAPKTLTLVPPPHATNDVYVDECAQEWDCESDDWAQSQSEEPSLVLEAADTLDGIASILRDAAEVLRGLASRNVATARSVEGNLPR
ncbi:MAG TPA: hypothetical protein VMM76_12650 [Pirellulaceae bacterium]|nr:hypothetical protein [Pirellulaceae bacterium]